MANDIFERHEIKFLLDTQQRLFMERAIREHMRPDEHGESTVCNIYYDTPSFQLIRHSLEKPIYKEKIRMRSYGPVNDGETVFLELKKKYDGVVYKRRIALPLETAEAYMDGKLPMPADSQIGREIDWFCRFYRDLSPAAHISYDRSAWFDREDPELRVTFDRNILWQTEDCSLSTIPFGHRLLGYGESLMEIKTATAIPMWLVAALDRAQIRKTSFSKYGSAYQAMMAGERRGVSCA